ncbi:hypothetical protein ACVFZR_12015, partial [Lacticaseibacillus paracasei]
SFIFNRQLRNPSAPLYTNCMDSTSNMYFLYCSPRVTLESQACDEAADKLVSHADEIHELFRTS